jgi:hypothetical protein
MKENNKFIFWAGLSVALGLLVTATLGYAQYSGSLWYPNSDNRLQPVDDSWGIYTAQSIDFDGELLPDGATCNNGEILKKTGANNWDCAADETGAGGSGDVTDVGDCAGGACLDGTSDGGTYIKFYDAQGAGQLITGDLTAARVWTLPDATGTVALTTSNVATATALAANPTDCAANQFANTIAASGNLTCAAIGDADVPNTITIDNAGAVEGTDLGTLTNGLVCTYDLAGTEIDCATTMTPDQVGTLTNTKWCTTDGSLVNCTSNAPVLTEVDPNVDTEAEIEAITGAHFGASKAVTSGYIWVADGTDFESVVMSGDVTIASGGATTAAAGITRDTEWDTAAEINAATTDADFLTGNQTITLSGDVSGSGATAITTTIGANKILESMLKAVNDPTDELCLTYESTTGDFEWQSCGGTPTVITVADTADTTAYVALFEDATGDLGPKTDAGITYNAGTGMLTATGFTGPLTGNASTATALAGDPADCAANNYAYAINASGTLTCSTIDISASTNLAVSTPITLTGDSVGMVNQGTTTTVLHGNAAGNPSFGAVVVADTSITAGRSLTWSTNNMVADAETYTDTKCIFWENPVATDDFKSIWFAKQAATVTSLWCESDQVVTMMGQIDDGTPADMDSVDMTCDATPPEDTALNGDATLASGDRVDVDVASVSGTPTWVSFCFTFTYDD